MESTQKAPEFSHLSDTVHPDQGTGEIGDPKPKAGGGVGSLAVGVSDGEAVLCANPIGSLRSLWKWDDIEVRGEFVSIQPSDLVHREQRDLEAPEGGDGVGSDSTPESVWAGSDMPDDVKLVAKELAYRQMEENRLWMDQAKPFELTVNVGASEGVMGTGGRDYRVWVAEPESSCMMAVYGRLAERWQG